MKFITVKPMRYLESGGIEDYGYIPKGTVCETAVVDGCEAVLHHGKVVCDVDSGMTGEYFREVDWVKEENKYVELAKHCIGLDRKKPYTRHGKKFYRPYRNFYAAGRNTEGWDMMVDAGYADRDKEKNQHGGYTYWMTRAGLDWLGERLEIHIHDEED